MKTWTSRRKECVEQIEIVETVETNYQKAQNEKLEKMTTRPIVKCIFKKKHIYGRSSRTNQKEYVDSSKADRK